MGFQNCSPPHGSCGLAFSCAQWWFGADGQPNSVPSVSSLQLRQRHFIRSFFASKREFLETSLGSVEFGHPPVRGHLPKLFPRGLLQG